MNKFSEARDIICEEAAQRTRDAMVNARDAIDCEFGKGFSERNPQFLVAFIEAAMIAYAGSIIAAAIQERSRD